MLYKHRLYLDVLLVPVLLQNLNGVHRTIGTNDIISHAMLMPEAHIVMDHSMRMIYTVINQFLKILDNKARKIKPTFSGKIYVPQTGKSNREAVIFQPCEELNRQ